MEVVKESVDVKEDTNPLSKLSLEELRAEYDKTAADAGKHQYQILAMSQGLQHLNMLMSQLNTYMIKKESANGEG